MELMGNRRLLIFLRRREKYMVLYGRKINGKPTGGCGSLEIPAVNADGGCNQHEAMRNHGVSFSDAKNTASFMERNEQF